MSISSTVKKFMPYLKTATDYVLYRLSSQAVEMDDGSTLESKVTSLNNLISNKLNSANVINNLTTTNSGYALDARQGKALDDKITQLNSALAHMSGIVSTLTNGGVEFTSRIYQPGECYIDGQVNSDQCEIMYMRIYSQSDRSLLIGTMVSAYDGNWWDKYVASSTILITKNVGSEWYGWVSLTSE